MLELALNLTFRPVEDKIIDQIKSCFSSEVTKLLPRAGFGSQIKVKLVTKFFVKDLHCS